MAPLKARTPAYLILTSIVASAAGLCYGYSIGISVVDSFQKRGLYETIYLEACSWNRSLISSMYLAGFIACFPASFVTKHYGRRPSIILGGLSFISGAALAGAAQNTIMLIFGKIMLGVGAGFGNQAVPVYLSEMAPPKLRGTLNIMFQLAISIGILCAFLVWSVMEVVSDTKAWRISLGLAGAPAILMTIGGMLLPETPYSLIERGYFQQARSLLTNIRGTPEVEAEYEVIKEAGYHASSAAGFTMLLKQRQSRPQLVMAVIIPLLQQFSGGIGVLIHADLVITGSHFHGGLYCLIASGVNVFGTLFNITNVDRWGRRLFFLEGGFQMFFSLIILAVIEINYRNTPDFIVVTILCVYVCAFAWSWGPLGWLLPSEIFPAETRSAGQAVAVASNMLFTLIILQSFPVMFCNLSYGTLFFFAGWCLS